mmetsp:Transcript_44073/g.60191  ORF Transcript_44073/g.60191 Transcript_44073/m.60191 type:complete len:262 (-) Transcript_44073:1420-2205(-)
MNLNEVVVYRGDSKFWRSRRPSVAGRAAAAVGAEFDRVVRKRPGGGVVSAPVGTPPFGMDTEETLLPTRQGRDINDEFMLSIVVEYLSFFERVRCGAVSHVWNAVFYRTGACSAGNKSHEAEMSLPRIPSAQSYLNSVCRFLWLRCLRSLYRLVLPFPPLSPLAFSPYGCPVISPLSQFTPNYATLRAVQRTFSSERSSIALGPSRTVESLSAMTLVPPTLPYTSHPSSTFGSSTSAPASSLTGLPSPLSLLHFRSWRCST